MTARRSAPLSTRQAWLRLLRPPNLPTVPGDPAAGFLVAWSVVYASADGATDDATTMLWRMAPVAGAALLLYMAGLVGGDRVDIEEDRRHRPGRPLPSGAVSPRAATMAALGLGLAGIAVAALAGWMAAAAAAGVAALVAFYTLWAKHRVMTGSIAMGLCRGASVAMGAVALGRGGFVWPVAVAAGGVAVYIAAVTRLAAEETERTRLGFRRWLPAAGLLLCFALFFWIRKSAEGPSVLLATVSVAWALYVGYLVGPAPAPERLGPGVGRWIRGLLPIQAAFCVTGTGTAGLVTAAGLLVLWPVSKRLGRWFYAS
jgi:4-hydroxybenzoate polyprenyltransferase